MTRFRAGGLITLCLAVLLGAAACSARDDGATSTAGAPAADFQGKPEAKAGEDMSAGDVTAPRNGAEAPKEEASAPPEAGTTDRAIIYTGTITLEVKDVAAVADQATALALGARGFVGADKRSLSEAPTAHAELVLQVPSAAFASTLDGLGKLGKETDRATRTADVTEAVIDLDARIASQQASVTRTRALLAKANTISEIVSVESELTKRESQLASLQARKRDLSGQVAYSAITVMLRTPGTVTPEPKPEDPGTGFVAGLKSGWHAFVTAVEIVLTIIGALLPFIVVFVLPVLLFLALRRRRARRALTPPPVVPAQPAVPAQPVSVEAEPAER